MEQNLIHRKYMQRCLELALNGEGLTAPNPMVGSVIVCGDSIIGEGWHRCCGQAHAEVNAVADVADTSQLSRSTLYVNLEPCCHHGKTPPCADLIIRSGIPHVVVGMQDPFSKVNGEGIRRMRQAGIRVETGVMEEECRFLNRRFLTFHEKKRPYVLLKWAQTADGFLDNDRPAHVPPTWMTGYAAKVLVHRMRAAEGAIMVGTGTVLRDDPSLTVREWYGRQPLRLVPDRCGRLDDSKAIFSPGTSTVVFVEKGRLAPVHYPEGVTVTGIDFDCSQREILDFLYTQDVQSVMIEGGARMLESFLQNDLWDEAAVFTSDLYLRDLKGGRGGGVPAPEPKGTACFLQHIGEVKLERYFPGSSIAFCR